MSEVIIPDEWLVHDLMGENGEEAQRATIAFHGTILQKCDRIAILRGSPFAGKVLDLMGTEDVRLRRLARYLRLQFIENSKKCLILQTGKDLDIQLSARVPISDRYLFEVRELLGEGTIVTTDSDLTGLDGVKTRVDFLRGYS